jgi:hypothetical protein
MSLRNGVIIRNPDNRRFIFQTKQIFQTLQCQSLKNLFYAKIKITGTNVHRWIYGWY